MNLHEECLLKYLLNPVGLTISTETLKQNNELLQKTVQSGAFLANTSKMIYSTYRY